MKLGLMRNRSADQIAQMCKTFADIFPKMHTQSPPMPFDQNLEIAARLRRFHYTERIFLLRHRQIFGIFTGDLEEHAGIGTSFVSLPGAVEKARAEAEDGRDAL